jgi:hypothetical protein
MPFINGHYHMNPVMGEALEAAREAEAALLALEQRARQNGNGRESDGGADDEFDAGGSSAGRQQGPIHRIEIEAAELVPAHSGRAARGYVARVHRQPASGTAAPRAAGDASANRGGVLRSAQDDKLAGAGTGAGGPRTGNAHGAAETHVFADHRDLVSFLRDELAKDRTNSSVSSQR